RFSRDWSSDVCSSDLGDFTHIDNLVNRTPNKGTPLDASGRFIEIAQAAMEIAIYVINAVARHHEDVTVIWQSGNHDEATALVLRSERASCRERAEVQA